MFVACGIWCLADVSSVSPSSEQIELSLNSLKVLQECKDDNFAIIIFQV